MIHFYFSLIFIYINNPFNISFPISIKSKSSINFLVLSYILSNKNNICSSIYGFVNHQDIVNNLDSDMYLFDGEGIHYKNFFGTFVLGPILSRNPEFLEYFFKGFVSSIDDKFKFKDMNVALNKKAYDEFIEFKKTKVFNSHNA